jgi:hypothetical protein
MAVSRRITSVLVSLAVVVIVLHRFYLLQVRVFITASLDERATTIISQPQHIDESRTTLKNKTESASSKALVLPPQNQTLEERFAPYAPSNAPLSDFVRRQMNRKRSITWPLKVNTPIFIASLPKSGTSSAWRYFTCSGHLAAHTFSKTNQTSVHRIGECLERNIQQNRKPFHDCGHYYIWSDCGYVPPLASKEPARCFYPSIHALDALYEAYPKMTILLMQRNVTEWAKSVRSYASMGQRWQKCGLMAKYNDLESLYAQHMTGLRRFAQEHPSITYVEISLEGNGTAQSMQDAFGGPASCWRNCAPGMRFKDCKVI